MLHDGQQQRDPTIKPGWPATPGSRSVLATRWSQLVLLAGRRLAASGIPPWDRGATEHLEPAGVRRLIKYAARRIVDTLLPYRIMLRPQRIPDNHDHPSLGCTT